MKITEQRLKKLEREANKIYNPVEIPPIIFNDYQKQHPELTEAEIDEVYKKAGVIPIKIVISKEAKEQYNDNETKA